MAPSFNSGGNGYCISLIYSKLQLFDCTGAMQAVSLCSAFQSKQTTKRAPSLSRHYIWRCCGYVTIHCLPLFGYHMWLLHCFKFTIPLHKSISLLYYFKNLFSIQTYVFFYQISFSFYIIKRESWWPPWEDTALVTKNIKDKQTRSKRIIAGMTQHFIYCLFIFMRLNTMYQSGRKKSHVFLVRRPRKNNPNLEK